MANGRKLKEEIKTNMVRVRLLVCLHIIVWTSDSDVRDLAHVSLVQAYLPRGWSLQQAAKRGPCRRAVSGWVSVTFVYCVETAKDTAVVAVECAQETVSKLSNGAICNDLE